MTATLRVEQTGSRMVIDAILADEWIAPKIEQNGQGAGYIDHPLVDYFGAWIDGRWAGVFTRIHFTDIESEVHAALLREALPYSRELGALFLDIVFAEPQVERATAHVIGSLTTAVNYCLKLGFQIEGVRRNACLQKSRLLPVITLGLLRNEWEFERGRPLSPLSARL